MVKTRLKVSRISSLIKSSILRIRGISNYQFGEVVGEQLFPDECEIEFSRRTGKIRRVFLHSKVLATIRARDGRIVLTMLGAQRLHQAVPPPRLRVFVDTEGEHFIVEGRSIFAKYVKKVDSNLRAGDEVLVVNDQDKLLAVGSAVLSPQEMLDLSRGVAVKSRHSSKGS